MSRFGTSAQFDPFAPIREPYLGQRTTEPDPRIFDPAGEARGRCLPGESPEGLDRPRRAGLAGERAMAFGPGPPERHRTRRCFAPRQGLPPGQEHRPPSLRRGGREPLDRGEGPRGRARGRPPGPGPHPVRGRLPVVPAPPRHHRRCQIRGRSSRSALRVAGLVDLRRRLRPIDRRLPRPLGPALLRTVEQPVDPPHPGRSEMNAPPCPACGTVAKGLQARGLPTIRVGGGSTWPVEEGEWNPLPPGSGGRPGDRASAHRIARRIKRLRSGDPR